MKRMRQSEQHETQQHTRQSQQGLKGQGARTAAGRRTMFTRLSTARQWKCVEWMLLLMTAASMAVASLGQGRGVPYQRSSQNQPGGSPSVSPVGAHLAPTGALAMAPTVLRAPLPLRMGTAAAATIPGLSKPAVYVEPRLVRPASSTAVESARKAPSAASARIRASVWTANPAMANRGVRKEGSARAASASPWTGQAHPELIADADNYSGDVHALNEPPALLKSGYASPGSSSPGSSSSSSSSSAASSSSSSSSAASSSAASSSAASSSAASSAGHSGGASGNNYPVSRRDPVLVEASNSSDILHLPVGRSMVLSTGVSLRRVYVGDPKILQSFSSGPKEDVITARVPGVSTLILWDADNRRRMYTVYADYDTDGLSRAIAEAMPDANITVTSKTNRIYLSGTVANDAAAEALNRLANTYSKDLVNGVRVVPVHAQQIELKLRIVEVDRNRLADYGINFFGLGSTLSSTSTQQFATTATAGPPVSVSDPLNLLLFSSKLNAGVTVKDLEQKQILQVLAEPTLTTLSGIAARFLSGGEFPLPVVQGGTGNSTAITIVWKPYGVKVDFTPTANPDGTIRLKVAPEVSTLDYTNAVTISGFVIPALSTRRAETEVELRNGQSFVLSGLLDHRTADNLSRMPGIASVPILGQLFRSKGLTLSTVDLVVVVTATFVDPLTGPMQQMAEPEMILPNLDKERFDQAVVGKGQPATSLNPPAAPPAAPTATPTATRNAAPTMKVTP